MSGEAKKAAHEYTPQEIGAMSDEQLAQLAADEQAAADALTATADEEQAAAVAAATITTEPPLDPAAVARLAAEDDPREQGGIPRGRFNEVNNERKLLLDEVLRLRALAAAPAAPAAPVVPAYDFRAKRAEYHKLVAELDHEAAARLYDEIEEARDAKTQADIAAAAAKAAKDATEESDRRYSAQRTKDRVGVALGEVYSKYPFLNHEKPGTASSMAINAVIARRDALANDPSNPMDPVDAMIQAADEIGQEFLKFTGGAAVPATTAGATGAAAAAAAADPRVTEEVRRAAAAAGKQPPVPTGLGQGTREGSVKLDINKLTDEQLLKLSPAELAELRGDNRIPA